MDKWLAPGAKRARERRTEDKYRGPITQGKKGDRVVYFIAQGPYVKIGTTNDFERRLKQLRFWSPVQFTVLGIAHGGFALERQIMRRFAASRVHGEWFEMTSALREFIDSILARAPVRPKNQAEVELDSNELSCVRSRDRLH